jgi:hypothetical protein
VPLILVGGPLAAVDNKNDQCKCLDCGRSAIPIEFDAVNDIEPFFGVDTDASGGEFLALPMLPLEMRGTKAEPLVRGVTWAEDGPYPFGGAVPIRQYMMDRGIANDAEMLLWDIEGFRTGNQDTEALKQLLRRRPSAWLSMGMTSEEDLFDGLYMGAGMVLADTFSMTSLELLKDLHELSDRCLPMVIYDGRVVWRREGERDLSKTLDTLTRMGYAEIVVYDIRPMAGKDATLVESLGRRGGIILGGGVIASHMPALKQAGFRGAILEPVLTITE